MNIKIPKQHLPFDIAYFSTLLILNLLYTDALPFSSVLRKVKYPYILFVGLLVILNKKVKKGIKAAFFVIIIYVAHNILFGTIFVNELVASYVVDNVLQMLWFWMFIIVTFLYIAQNNYFKGFIKLSYYACGLHLVLMGIMHRSDFVNPVWGLIQSFTADVRFKNTFGFVHPGYLSLDCFFVLFISIFFFEIYRYTEEIKKPWFWIVFCLIDGVTALELVSAAERSGIICTVMVFVPYFFFVFFRMRIEKKTLFMIVGVILIGVGIFVVTGGLASIWGDSNRELNISVNYPLFQAYANPWTGLGFIENSLFQSQNYLYPVPSSSLDMYYVYIFFSTGYIGSIMIGIALLTVLVKLLINKRTDFNIIGIWFYLTMLFFAVWQCNLFTHRYISSYVYSIIILCSMSNDFCMGADECINTKSTELPLSQT